MVMHGGGGGSEVSPTPGKRGALKKTKFEIIPMIDTMFFLLVFFILSSVGALKLQGINLQMPKQGGPTTDPLQQEKDPPLDIMINIKPDGQMFVGAKPVPPTGGIPELIVQQAVKDKHLFEGDEAKLEAELKRAIVVVNADPQATHELVIKAIDEARKLKRRSDDPDPDPKTKQAVGNSLLTQFAIANSAEEPATAPPGGGGAPATP